MAEWFQDLSGLQQTLFGIAVVSTAVFAIQVIFTLFGIGEFDDLELGEGGGEGTPFGDIFTIRNGVSFLMGLSWGGLMAYSWGLTHAVFAILIGFLVGSLFVGLNMGLLALMAMVKHEGNVQLENAVGQEARVTLAVPEGRSGVGKVSLSLQGRLKEYHAVTDGRALQRNSPVTVVDISGSQLVVATL